MPIFPDSADIITIVAGGQAWSGFTEANITLSLANAAGSFRVKIVESVHGSPIFLAFSQSVEVGDECAVLVNGQKVITGYVNSRVASKDADSHSIDIAGRSKTQDVVDSSAVGGPQYNKLKPSQIVETLAEKYGLKVVKKIQSERAIDVFRHALGEDALRVMRRAARQEGITVTDDSDGNVVLINKFEDRAPAALIAGENLLRWTVEKTDVARYGEYRGRSAKVPTSDMRGKTANQVAAKAVDQSIRPTRIKYVAGEGDQDGERTKNRTAHEAARRAGFSVNVKCTVKGWTAAGGLWKPGQLVFVSIPDEGVGQELLIESCEFATHANSPGTTTSLTLVPREAYEKGKSQGGSASKASGPTTGNTSGNGTTGSVPLRPLVPELQFSVEGTS